MARVELKGLHTVNAKGRTYVYAWRGGPALPGVPGSSEFMAAYNEAIADRAVPEKGRFRTAIASYRASDAYKALAPSTKKQWSRWLDIISTHFGELKTAQFGRAKAIRPIILKWRGTYADRPRAADYGMQVLSRVLSHLVQTGEIAENPVTGVKHIYSADRSEIIWSDEDLTTIKAACSDELGLAFDLAAHTGLRLGDLVRLSWSHIREHEIVISTGKGRRKKRKAIIPLYDDLRQLLARIPKRATTVLTSTKKRPWTVNGIGTSIHDAKFAAGMSGLDLHFHDLRGTAATKFYLAGLDDRVIAEILAWEEDAVRRIIRRYVGRNAATMDAIRRLNEAKSRT